MLNIDAEFNELLLVFRPNPRGLGAIGEFGEFGSALGELSAVEQEIHAQWRGIVKSGLGELSDITADIAAAKAAISKATDIGGQINSLKSRISRLQNKIAKVKNPAAKAKIQSRLTAALPQLAIAEGAYNAMKSVVGAATDFLKNAGIAVEEAKKAVVETAGKAREKAMEVVGKAKEMAVAAGEKVKAAAGAAAAAAKAAAVRVKAAAGAAAAAAKAKVAQVGVKAKAVAAAAAARAAQMAAAAKAAAAQKVAQARAMAAAAAQRVQQAAAAARARAAQIAAQAAATARARAQAAAQRVQQAAAAAGAAAAAAAARAAQVAASARAAAASAASKVKSWFGFKGLEEYNGLGVVFTAGAATLAITAAMAALQIANMYIGQGEAVPEDSTAIPETIPMVEMEKYKDAAADCYNSAVAQGYKVDTAEKSALLEKTCRERAAVQFAVPSDMIPYTGTDLIDEFEVPPGYTPGVDYPIQLPEGGGCFSLSTGMPEPCRDVEPYVPPGGYTPGYDIPTGDYYPEQPLPDGRRIIYPTPSEPGIYDEFETLVPGMEPVPGYPPGMPTTVPSYPPGVTPSYPGYEPGITPSYEPGAPPTYAPGVEMPSGVECPDYPDMTDAEYCSYFPQCCEDIPEGCPDIPDMTDDEYCANFPQCCEEAGEAETGKSPWEFDTGIFGF